MIDLIWKYCQEGHEHICFASEGCPLCAANKQIMDLLASSLYRALGDRTPCSDGHSVIWYDSEECPLCEEMKIPRMGCGDGT